MSSNIVSLSIKTNANTNSVCKCLVYITSLLVNASSVAKK